MDELGQRDVVDFSQGLGKEEEEEKEEEAASFWSSPAIFPLFPFGIQTNCLALSQLLELGTLLSLDPSNKGNHIPLPGTKHAAPAVCSPGA